MFPQPIYDIKTMTFVIIINKQLGFFEKNLKQATLWTNSKHISGGLKHFYILFYVFNWKSLYGIYSGKTLLHLSKYKPLMNMVLYL